MNKKLLAKINRALENTKASKLAPVTKEALQKRLTQELDWADAAPDHWAFIQLLNDVMEKVRSAGIVTSPGFGFLTTSFLLYLTGVTRVNPVEWDLPFSRFLRSFDNGSEFILETGTGGLAVATKFLQNRDNLVAEIKLGTFQITFLEGNINRPIVLTIIEYAELDRFKSTLKYGWHPLNEATLRLFSRGDSDGSIWFETDKMREWLTEFEPESMSDLVLLNALYHPDRIGLYPEILRRKRMQDYKPPFQDTYGVPIYQEQVFDPKLALKGHFVSRTMLSVEALWHRRFKTSLR